jgi:prephenate dehydrogenase
MLNNALTKESKILIVGVGLIGGSYAMGLTAKGYHVSAIDINAESIEFGLKQGIFEAGYTETKPEVLGEADFVIIGLYPTAMLNWLRENQQYLRPGTLITDVSGVKSNIVDVAQEFLRPDLEFCASHPMAGKETSGIQNADYHIFKQANFIITPTEKNTPEGIATIRKLAELLEFKTIRELDIKSHDHMIGFLSQLTHAIAVSLMTCNDDEELGFFTGDSFRDLTRIARINDVMWSELFLLNRDILIENIDCFSSELQRLRGLLIANDRPGLQEMFRKSTARRMQFDEAKAHKPETK